MGFDFYASGPFASGASHPHGNTAQPSYVLHATGVLDGPLVYLSEVPADGGIFEDDNGRSWPEKCRASGSAGGRREPVRFLDDAPRLGCKVCSPGNRRPVAAC